MADKREANPGKLTFQQQSENNAEAAPSPLSPVEQEFWQNMIERAGSPEPNQDPVYYPVYALGRAEDLIQNGKRGPDGRLRRQDERAAITPMFDSIRRVKTAYQILAYSRCDDDHRAAIERDLTRERNWYTRDKVELTGTEAMILTTLTHAADIPSDPQRRTFLHTDIRRPRQSLTAISRTPDASTPPIPQTAGPASQTRADTTGPVRTLLPRTSPNTK